MSKGVGAWRPIVAILFMTAAVSLPLAARAQARPGAEGAFGRCAICHSTRAGAGPSIGPNLAGLLGRKVGSAPGFTYSRAMAKADFVWDKARLDAFLRAPQTVVRGNRMAFGGISDAATRADLVAYLASRS
ncbi:MAG: c-type cytochrome [Phenylobacterium sp.]|uniref:c-type cytochrome n=1 Tax=Phenylobacterium sp. TaxID=1871053 RepID=UPI002734DDE5|nr:c-type cytochrome [Phenylobacterium sp.]MDP3749561.1 c-type cytochrome [Phenylobacterium sp.]